MLRKPLKGDPLAKVGANVHKNVFQSLGASKRSMLYDIKTKKFKGKASIDKMTNLDREDPEFLEQLSAYIQGVVLYGMMGVFGVMICLMWSFVLLGVCCWGCCITCSCKRKSTLLKEEPDKGDGEYDLSSLEISEDKEEEVVPENSPADMESKYLIASKKLMMRKRRNSIGRLSVFLFMSFMFILVLYVFVRLIVSI